MKEMTVKELYTLEETIAKDIFDGITYPWEVLPKISNFILELGATLPEEEYEKRGENVWVAAECFVGPGVNIGEGAVVGARAAVFKNVDPWTIVGGNPAKFIKKRIFQD